MQTTVYVIHGKIVAHTECKFKLNIKINNHELDNQADDELEFSVLQSSPTMIICRCLAQIDEFEVEGNVENEIVEHEPNGYGVDGNEMYENENVDDDQIIVEEEIVIENVIFDNEYLEDQNNEEGVVEDVINDEEIIENEYENVIIEEVVDGNEAIEEEIIENMINDDEIAEKEINEKSPKSRYQKRPARAASLIEKNAFEKRQKMSTTK